MQTEIEAKFTNIDVEKTRTALKQAGAALVYPERQMKRINFNLSDGANAWVRVRHEGDKVTMAYKRTFERTLHGTKEINLIVDNFDNAVELLEALGLKGKAYQETKREAWSLNNCDITLDTWPWIPTFIEIEGPSEEAVREVASTLGFDWSQAMHGSVETVYQEHYNVTEAEIDAWPRITFEPVPDWLEKTRKA